MAQYSDPSYLLADFPSTDNPPDVHDERDARTIDVSIDSADAPEPGQGQKAQKDERGFKRKFMPGRLFADCAATLVPIALIAFAIAIMRLDNKEAEQEDYHKWRNAINVIASAFPIAFASIVGRMVFEAARWKLEKGATLGLLEQLIGSRTVGSTFITQICLGKFNILGLVLLLLWAFSPLGSQAVLRTLGSKLEPVLSNSSVLYFSTDAKTELATPYPINPVMSNSEVRWKGQLRSMFVSLFFTSEERKTDPMDLWGNVKIPNLDIDDDRWHNVTSEPGPDSYSALLGLPVTNITPGNVTFSLESSYLHLDCWNYSRTDPSNTPSSPFFNWTDPSVLYPGPPKPNGTWHGHSMHTLQSTWSIVVDRFVGPYWDSPQNLTARLGTMPKPGDGYMSYGHPRAFKNETGLQVEAAKLLFLSRFMSWAHGGGAAVMAECYAMQRYVESRVHCSRLDMSSPQNCSVTSQRLSRRKHATENITLLNWENVWGRVTLLPKLLGGNSEHADTVLQYLDNPRRNAVNHRTVPDDASLFNSTTQEQFGRRLGQVINTYLLLGQSYRTVMEVDPIFNGSITVPVEKSNLVEVYTVHWSWTILFLVSSLILLASGIISIVFAHLAIGPEVLGYASTVVHSSKYVELPAEAGKKEAFEVVKMLGQKRLRYGYVDSVAEDGQCIVGVGMESETGDIHKR
ncbi:unnamed protein product [Fusarium graminearum]|nr:hypothetical protein FGRA07_03698 [Fusarium graminearum]CAF3652217.1 unnamed protein product [Fusarium graminearum]CAG1986475.1 unnamed protein product [Fusarium graminearum]CZS83014.1 unnamed protein product [Fusarium graminearum]